MIYTFLQPVKVADVGEKAFGLSQLAQQGLPVPMGLVVSHEAFKRFLETNSLKSQIRACLDEHKGSLDPHELRKTSQKIKSLVMSTDVPADLKLQLEQHLVDFDCRYLMVRSSAVGEDSEHHSFAGQLDSFKSELELGALVGRIKECWASYWSERCLHYQIASGFELKGMGVVVQSGVDPLLAGVLFSQDPMMNESHACAEFCFGHAEKLVSGQMTPGKVSIDRRRLDLNITMPQDGIRLIEDLKRFKDAIRQLVGFCFDLEEKHQCLLDMEWTINGDYKLEIVQVRPVTTGDVGFDALIYPDESDPGSSRRRPWKVDVSHFSNVNVNENYPEPISPMLYTLSLTFYYYYFAGLGRATGIRSSRIEFMDLYLKNMIGCHGGRMYYNLTSIHNCLSALPGAEMVSTYFNRFVGSYDEDDTEVRTHKLHASSHIMLQIYEMVRIVVFSIWTLIRAPRSIRRLVTEVDQFVAKAESMVMSPLQRLEEFTRIGIYRWHNGGLADLLSMFSYGLLGTLTQRWLRDDELTNAQNDLVRGIEGVVSAEPPQKIWELAQIAKKDPAVVERFRSDDIAHLASSLKSHLPDAEFTKKFDQYLKDYGFRCTGELMLTWPNYRENPGALLTIIANMLDSEDEAPVEKMKNEVVFRDELLKKIRRYMMYRNPLFGIFKFFILKTVVVFAHKSIAAREFVRMRQAKIYAELRRTLLEVGAEMTQDDVILAKEDVFFLHFDELVDYLSGASMFPDAISQVIEVRKQALRRVSKVIPPDQLDLPVGSYLDYTKGQELAEVIPLAPKEQASGIAACGGVVTARIRVLDSVFDVAKLQKGDILVTKQTDPGWGPVFPLIAGLIIERGGMLSHGAIIAREFGIPAVVGVDGITRRLVDGAQVELNGSTGTITVL